MNGMVNGAHYVDMTTFGRATKIMVVGCALGRVLSTHVCGSMPSDNRILCAKGRNILNDMALLIIIDLKWHIKLH